MTFGSRQPATSTDVESLRKDIGALSAKLDTQAEKKFSDIDLDFTQPDINTGSDFTGDTDTTTANKLADGKTLVLGALVIWLVFKILKHL